MTGFHSVIERPDSVSLVNPPTTTIPKIKPEVATSQYPAALLETTTGGCFPENADLRDSVLILGADPVERWEAVE